MQAVVETAHAHGRTVVTQSWTLDGSEVAALGIHEVHNTSRVFISKEYAAERLVKYASIAERLALTGRGWATIDWDATVPLMDAMILNGVPNCGMHVIAQFLVGEGVPELEADADFADIVVLNCEPLADLGTLRDIETVLGTGPCCGSSRDSNLAPNLGTSRHRSKACLICWSSSARRGSPLVATTHSAPANAGA